MKRRNWKKWREGAERRSAAARRAARIRWDREHEGMGTRRERVVRITIEDSAQPRQVIVGRLVEGDEGKWGRFRLEGLVTRAADGTVTSARPVGVMGLARVVAMAVLT
jgi:hypothetical protein